MKLFFTTYASIFTIVASAAGTRNVGKIVVISDAGVLCIFPSLERNVTKWILHIGA